MPDNIDLASLLAGQNIVALIALVATFGLTRLSKPDAWPNWFRVPARFRPLLAVLLGEVFAAITTGIYNAVYGNSDLTWQQWLKAGLTAGLGAILTHVGIVRVARDGKEIGLPKPLSVYPPPPPPGGGSGPVIPPHDRIPVIVDSDIPTTRTIDKRGGLDPDRRVRITLLAVGLAFSVSVSGCGFFKPRVIEALFDFGCVILNSELPDAVIDRVCAVPPDAQTEAHKAAAAARGVTAKARAEERQKAAACRPLDRELP